MSLVQLFVPTEVAHDTVSELGELGNVQFNDVRSPSIVVTQLTLVVQPVKPQRQPIPAFFCR